MADKPWLRLPRKGDELRSARLHLAVPESLLEEIRAAAAIEEISMTDYAIRALQLELNARQEVKKVDFDDV